MHLVGVRFNSLLSTECIFPVLSDQLSLIILQCPVLDLRCPAVFSIDREFEFYEFFHF